MVAGNYLDRSEWDLDGLRSDLAKHEVAKQAKVRSEAAKLAADTRSYEELLAYYTALPWLGASAREAHARAHFDAARAARRQRGELQPSPCWIKGRGGLACN